MLFVMHHTPNYRIRDLAIQAGVTYDTACRWARRGTVQAVKRGKLWLIPPDEMSRFLARKRDELPPPIDEILNVDGEQC